MEIYKLRNVYIMQLGNKSFSCLKAYIDGYIEYAIELNPNFKSVYFEFYRYILNVYRMPNDAHWDRVLQAYSDSDEIAFDAFYRHLDRFLTEKELDFYIDKY